MNIIFLDVDGVLNDDRTRERCCGMIGIAPHKVANLKYIVENANAKIVLISSWKNMWDFTRSKQHKNMGMYLDGQLAAESLHIENKTKDEGFNRGEGILQFLETHPAEAWVVLDDETFDYEECGIMPHLIQTDFNNGGLTKKLAHSAVVLMNQQLAKNSKLCHNTIK